MKKQRRLIKQVNTGKVGKRLKSQFRNIQRDLIDERNLEAKKKRELELKGNNYSGVPPSSIEGLPGHIPFGLPATEDSSLESVLPQAIADDAFNEVQKAKEDSYSLFRDDLKQALAGAIGSLKTFVADFLISVEKVTQNDPEWAKMGIEKKARILNIIANSAEKINAMEVAWVRPESKKGQPQLHFHYNVPDDPAEIAKQLVELDAILGRTPVIPVPLPGQQQRILIETKPFKEDSKEEPLQISSGKE